MGDWDEFVFGLTRVSKADRVCLQELLQLWKGFPRAAGKRHEADPSLVPHSGLEYLITVRGLHGRALLLPVISSSYQFFQVLLMTLKDFQVLLIAFNCCLSLPHVHAASHLYMTSASHSQLRMRKSAGSRPTVAKPSLVQRRTAPSLLAATKLNCIAW